MYFVSDISGVGPNSLTHYGVKGMKGGNRRNIDLPSASRPQLSRNAAGPRYSGGGGGSAEEEEEWVKTEDGKIMSKDGKVWVQAYSPQAVKASQKAGSAAVEKALAKVTKMQVPKSKQTRGEKVTQAKGEKIAKDTIANGRALQKKTHIKK